MKSSYSTAILLFSATLGAQPQFDQAADLSRAETGITYSQTITVSGGDPVFLLKRERLISICALSMPMAIRPGEPSPFRWFRARPTRRS